MNADSSALLHRLTTLRERLGPPWKVPPPPTTVDLQPTLRCPLQCRYCDLWKADPSNELGLEDWINVLRELAAWIGPCHCILGGGEPLMAPFLPSLIAEATRLGLRTTVATSGLLLSPPLLEELAAAGLCCLSLSLDAVGPVHDELRRRPGLFAHVSAMLDHLAGMGSRPSVHAVSVLTAVNLKELPELVHWVGAHPVVSSMRLQAVAQPFFAPFRPDWYQTSELWPHDPRAVDTLVDTLRRQKDAGLPLCNEVHQLEFFRLYFRDPNQFVRHRCAVGSTSLSIGHLGQVSSCMNLGQIGNVREHGLAELWASPRAALLRQRIRECSLSCNLPVNCNFEPNAELVFGPDWRARVGAWDEPSQEETAAAAPGRRSNS